MMQDFLNQLSGNTEQEQIDPLETLIEKRNIGRRRYSFVYKLILGVSSTCLVVTLSETFPIFKNLIAIVYASIILMGAIEVMREMGENGIITRDRVKAYALFYLAIILFISLIIAIIVSI
jgi:hypothetical protein